MVPRLGRGPPQQTVRIASARRSLPSLTNIISFGEDWARLTKDLLFDSEGSLKFKPELWMDIRKVILPSIIDQVGRDVFWMECIV